MYVILCSLTAIAVFYYLYSFKKPSWVSSACNMPLHTIIDSRIQGPCIGIVCGVHGNEPAAVSVVQKMLKNGQVNLQSGKLVIIVANPCGLKLNQRENPYTHKDINRSFTSSGGTDESTSNIINLLQTCDVIIDFHEGWGWYSQPPSIINWYAKSIGSTLSPSNDAIWNFLPSVVDELNSSIDASFKKFALLKDTSCEIATSLACWAQNNNIPYLLVETTGQDNVQKMIIREQQIRIVLRSILEALNVV